MASQRDKQEQDMNDVEQWAVQENTPPMEDLRTWQQRLLRGVLRALAVIGIPALVFGAYSAYETQDTWLIPFYVVIYAFLLVITFWRRVPYTARAWAVVAVMYGMGILELSDSALSGEGRTFLLTLPILTAIFLGRRQSVILLVVAALTLAAFGWGYATGRLVPTVEAQDVTRDPTWWLNSVISLTMLGIALVISQNYLIPRLAQALTQSQQLARELEAHRDTLEEQVTERTAALARRNTQLEAAAQVAREAVAIRDIGTLLQETTRLISSRFGFYHAGIFLVDQAAEYAVLQAASSEGGRQMLARKHRLRVGHEGIVGYVTGKGEPRVALDVGEDAVFFDNPDLPATRSEMALPLQVRGQIIGALDVQSREPAAFANEDVTALQTLADQLAVAISNARLFQQAEERLEAERRIYGELSRQAWQALLHEQPEMEERYDPQSILPADGRWRKEMEVALREGRPVPGDDQPSATLAAPIRVRNQVIGVLDAHKPPDAGRWTAEETTLLETLADQLGVALESARLYQDVQRRAAREQLAGEVTARMRETLDIDTVLQTAVREMREILGLAEAEVRIGRGLASGDSSLRSE
jgi:GAF domain-containing protein